MESGYNKEVIHFNARAKKNIIFHGKIIKSTDIFFKSLFTSLNKAKRLADDVQIISSFLKTVPKLTELIASSKDDPDELFNQISLHLKLESITKNKLLYRVGIKIFIMKEKKETNYLLF